MNTPQNTDSKAAPKEGRQVNVFLSSDLQRFVEEEARARGGSLAEVIREAIRSLQKASRAAA